MVYRPKRFCRKQGCNQLVDEGYCVKHKPEEYQRYDRYRGTAAERGYNSKWRKARLRYLAEYPLCVECHESGLIVPATNVDHIVPHRGDMELFWDIENWQSLCATHHSQKTAKEDGGFGNGKAHD